MARCVARRLGPRGRRMPDAIAISGLSVRFAGAATLDEFWRNVRDGVETLETFSDEELDAAGVSAAMRSAPGYVPRGTVLPEAEHFDAAFFGVSPREAQII